MNEEKVKIPKPDFMTEENWVPVIAEREWVRSGDRWVELVDAGRRKAERIRAMSTGDADRRMYLATEGPWEARTGPTLLITTIGRKTGQEVTNAVNYLPFGSDVIVVGSLVGLPTHPHWALNLDKNPQARIQIKSRKWEGRARKLGAEEKERLWPVLTSVFPLWWYFQQFSEREFMLFRISPERRA